MQSRTVVVGVVAAALLAAVAVLFLLTPGEPALDVPEAAQAPEPSKAKGLATRIVTPQARPTPLPPAGLVLPSGLPPEGVPLEEMVYEPVPLPATFQGVRGLFTDHAKIVRRCLEDVTPPERDQGPLPSRVTVQLTVAPGDGKVSSISGIEVMGDYDRNFSGFTGCLATRFRDVRFQAPPDGMVRTLTWQQQVPRNAAP